MSARKRPALVMGVDVMVCMKTVIFKVCGLLLLVF